MPRFKRGRSQEQEKAQALENQMQEMPAEEQKVHQDLDESQAKVDRVKVQVEETRAIMQDNVDRTMTRGESLEQLESQTQKLQTESEQFSKNAQTVKTNLEWKRRKMAIIWSVVIIVIVAILIGVGVFMVKKNKKKKG